MDTITNQTTTGKKMDKQELADASGVSVEDIDELTGAMLIIMKEQGKL